MIRGSVGQARPDPSNLILFLTTCLLTDHPLDSNQFPTGFSTKTCSAATTLKLEI